MNAYFTLTINNRKPGMRVWRLFLTLSLDSTFNFFIKKNASIEYALDCISRIHESLRNELMEALRKF